MVRFRIAEALKILSSNYIVSYVRMLVVSRMSSTCIVCRKTGGKGVSMYRIPPESNPSKRWSFMDGQAQEKCTPSDDLMILS